jgi:hypothetical protein
MQWRLLVANFVGRLSTPRCSGSNSLRNLNIGSLVLRRPTADMTACGEKRTPPAQLCRPSSCASARRAPARCERSLPRPRRSCYGVFCPVRATARAKVGMLSPRPTIADTVLSALSMLPHVARRSSRMESNKVRRLQIVYQEDKIEYDPTRFRVCAQPNGIDIWPPLARACVRPFGHVAYRRLSRALSKAVRGSIVWVGLQMSGCGRRAIHIPSVVRY